MTLSSAFTIINSAFDSNAAQTAAVSRNITNANKTGYTIKTANLGTTSYGGAEVTSITRATNTALLDQMLAANSQAAQQSALATGLTQLSATVSDNSSVASSDTATTASGQSPAALLAGLQSALQNYEATPSNETVAQSVVSAASSLTTSLHNATATVQQVRSQADAAMAQSVTTINSLLGQFQTINDKIVSGLQTGADVTDAEDTRDNILGQLSQQIGVSAVTNSNGSESIYTDSGVTLFQVTARAVAFTPTPTLTAGNQGNAVMIDGIPVTGSSPMPIQSGALAGLATLRDSTAPQYQAQLDQIAYGLVNAFAETDQSGSATPGQPLPGLFTYSSFSTATGLPTDASLPVGLAGQISVNAAVDPSQGGDADLLRDGGIANAVAGNTNYTYNSTDAAGFTARIQQMISTISATQSFNPAAGAGASDGLSDYAAASASWVQAQYQQSSEQATYSSAVATTASQVLSNATGVNLDDETAHMLSLENSYQTSAKLLTTVNNMFASLMTAVTSALAS
jgi:flagellar hook-associated protein 1